MRGIDSMVDLDIHGSNVALLDDWQDDFLRSEEASLRESNAGMIESSETDESFMLPDEEPSSLENYLNSSRYNDLRRRFTRELIILIRESEVEFGFYSVVDSFIRDRLVENSSVTKEWLNSIFVENFHDVTIATGILVALSRLDYWDAYPNGLTIALAGLNHRSAEVRECAIRAFENWANPKSLDVLRTIKKQPEQWLNSYIAQVIRDLEAA